MKLRTLDVNMVPIGDNVKIACDCRYKIEAEHEKDTSWMLHLNVASIGNRPYRLPNGVTVPLPEGKNLELTVANEQASVPVSLNIGEESTFKFETMVEKTAILVRNNDNYIFSGVLEPITNLVPSNKAGHTISRDID